MRKNQVLAHDLLMCSCRINTPIWKSGAIRRLRMSHTTQAKGRNHIAKDELDTAREAAAEGQATAVMMDNILKPMGKSLIKDPEVVDFIKQQIAGSESSASPARHYCSQNLCCFPIREVLSFRTGCLDGPGSECCLLRRP